MAAALPVRNAILDGEIVYVGADGTPQFYDLMRRGPQHFYAFDLLWLDGRDLHSRPYLNGSGFCRQIVPPQPSPVLYVDHVAATGVDLFDAVLRAGPGGDRSEVGECSVHTRCNHQGSRSRTEPVREGLHRDDPRRHLPGGRRKCDRGTAQFPVQPEPDRDVSNAEALSRSVRASGEESFDLVARR
jgi:hypothetical protein